MARHAATVRRWPMVTVGASMATGFLVRVVRLTGNPPGFFADEASYGLNAHLVLTTGRDEHGALLPLLFRAFGEYKLPVFAYAEMPFLLVLGRTELAVRLTSAAVGTLTILSTYLLGKALFRRELPAVASACCLAVLPWHIHYSRVGFEAATLPLLVTTGLWLFVRAARRRTSLVPSAVVLALAFWSYRAAWVTLPPVLLFLVLSHRGELAARRRSAILAAAVGAVMLLPLVGHLLLGDGDRASQAWVFNVDGDRGTWSLMWEQYRSYFSIDFLFRFGDDGPILRHYLPGFGVLYWFLLPLVLAGIVRAVAGRHRHELLVLVLLVSYPLAGALSDSSPISSRTILGTITFALLSGLGLAALVDGAVGAGLASQPVAAAVLVAAVGVCAVQGFVSYLDRYFDDYPRLAAGYWGWQDGPQEIIELFRAAGDEYDDLYLDGAFNGTQVFIPFYAGDDCDRCRVGGLDRYDPNRRQLFALRAENPELDRYPHSVRAVLHYPDGTPSFYIIEVRPPGDGILASANRSPRLAGG
jgi:hypothetical protein